MTSRYKLKEAVHAANAIRDGKVWRDSWDYEVVSNMHTINGKVAGSPWPSPIVSHVAE